MSNGKINGGIVVTGRRGRRRRKLLAELKERRGYSHLKEEALDGTMWRARFGRGFGPVVRQNTIRMNGDVSFHTKPTLLMLVTADSPQSNNAGARLLTHCAHISQSALSHYDKEGFRNDYSAS
jgi:hypothetical protein